MIVAVGYYIRTKVTDAPIFLEAQKEVDVATFIQWIDAYAHRETELTTFYERRFRAEFKPAFNAGTGQDVTEKPAIPVEASTGGHSE